MKEQKDAEKRRRREVRRERERTGFSWWLYMRDGNCLIVAQIKLNRSFNMFVL